MKHTLETITREAVSLFEATTVDLAKEELPKLLKRFENHVNGDFVPEKVEDFRERLLYYKHLEREYNRISQTINDGRYHPLTVLMNNYAYIHKKGNLLFPRRELERVEDFAYINAYREVQITLKRTLFSIFNTVMYRLNCMEEGEKIKEELKLNIDWNPFENS
jgi:hypothetical protein